MDTTPRSSRWTYFSVTRFVVRSIAFYMTKGNIIQIPEQGDISVFPRLFVLN